MKHKGQLVCSHLEKISRAALEKHQEIIKDYVKGKHGIYALFSDGRLYYVGLASDLRNRLKNHLHDHHAGTWDRFSIYLTVSSDHLRDLEALVLKIASPSGNQKPGSFCKSEDLFRSIEQAFAAKQKKEKDLLFGRKQTARKKPEGKGTVKSGQPVLAPYIKGHMKIRLMYRGNLYKAIVKSDGTIFNKGQVYNSPSMAAAAIKGRPSNGWTDWKYQNSSGEWALLDNLRKK
jgi:hypothetical protein